MLQIFGAVRFLLVQIEVWNGRIMHACERMYPVYLHMSSKCHTFVEI